MNTRHVLKEFHAQADAVNLRSGTDKSARILNKSRPRRLLDVRAGWRRATASRPQYAVSGQLVASLMGATP